MAAPSNAQTTPPTTATRILDVAERLAQTSGFNGFSYADIAAELGITKASLHHHFATKAELGRALIVRYSEAFSTALEAVDRKGGDPVAKLQRYVKLYEDVLRGERLCLCGMLAAEYRTLPEALQKEIRRFFDINETWLAGFSAESLRAFFMPFPPLCRCDSRRLCLRGSRLAIPHFFVW